MSATAKTATFTLHDGSTLTAVDADGKPYGTLAFNEFIAKDTVKIITVSEGNETVTYVPFHAIISVVVEIEVVEPTTVEDANCNYAGC